MEQDKVDVRLVCGFCESWDGRKCSLYETHKAARKAARRVRSFTNKFFKPRRLFRKTRRYRDLPFVWEKWPSAQPDYGDDLTPEEGAGFGATSERYSTEPDIPDIGSEETILPELVKEEWDISPDVPDWDMEPDTASTQQPPPLPDLLPDSSQMEPFPPATNPLGQMEPLPDPGLDPGLNDMPGGPPGLPDQTLP